MRRGKVPFFERIKGSETGFSPFFRHDISAWPIYMLMSHYAKGGNTLSQQTSGLRFDIYERVHLPENTVGMRELNGIELTPEISVLAQGDQAVLKGHLVLSGTYTGEDETRSEEQLSHRIPVEITLPLNRIENVDDIRVEIENFDVDLLSARSLNVTGVLSLGGIEMVSAAETEWREEEQVVFTHRVEESAPAPKPAPRPAPQAAAAAAMEPPKAALEQQAAPPNPEAEVVVESVGAASNVPAAAERVEHEPAAVEAVENEPAAVGRVENETAPLVPAAQAGKAPNPEPNEASAGILAAEAAVEETKPEKQEIKIAFAGKSAQTGDQAPLGVNAIMSMAGAAQTEKRQAAAVSDAPPAQASASDAPEARDRLEWKKLFLQEGADETSFRRVRMCIAQKEDTLETIADRYNKSPRELALYNRINEAYLQEGQVVYIP
jgi:stage VI sporulation protein D